MAPAEKHAASRLRMLVTVLAGIVAHCVVLLLQGRPRELRLAKWRAVPEVVWNPALLSTNVAGSSIVPAAFLGCFRLAASAYIAGVGLLQLLRMRSHYGLPARAALLSFTVWTWWMLGLYFLCAGTVSVLQPFIGTRAVQPITSFSPPQTSSRRQAQARKQAADNSWTIPRIFAILHQPTTGTASPSAAAQQPNSLTPPQPLLLTALLPLPTSSHKPTGFPNGTAAIDNPHAPPACDSPLMPTTPPTSPPSRPLHALAQLASTLYHLNLTAVPIVVLTTWTVLLPSTYLLPDPALAAALRSMLLDFFSFNQHALNGLLLLADAAFNTIPFQPSCFPYVGLFQMLYTTVALTYFFRSSGGWIYPFMPTRSGWAPAAYLAMYLGVWGYFTGAGLFIRCKEALVPCLARLLSRSLTTTCAAASALLSRSSSAAAAPLGGLIHLTTRRTHLSLTAICVAASALLTLFMSLLPTTPILLQAALTVASASMALATALLPHRVSAQAVFAAAAALASALSALLPSTQPLRATAAAAASALLSLTTLLPPRQLLLAFKSTALAAARQLLPSAVVPLFRSSHGMPTPATRLCVTPGHHQHYAPSPLPRPHSPALMERRRQSAMRLQQKAVALAYFPQLPGSALMRSAVRRMTPAAAAGASTVLSMLCCAVRGAGPSLRHPRVGTLDPQDDRPRWGAYTNPPALDSHLDHCPSLEAGFDTRAGHQGQHSASAGGWLEASGPGSYGRWGADDGVADGTDLQLWLPTAAGLMAAAPLFCRLKALQARPTAGGTLSHGGPGWWWGGGGGRGLLGGARSKGGERVLGIDRLPAAAAQRPVAVGAAGCGALMLP